MKTKAWIPVAALIVLLGAGAAWLMSSRTPRAPASLTEAPAAKVEPLPWERLIESLADKEGAEIRQHGLRFFQAGDPDKAFLLFKQAARKGDGWSAMVIGEMYDPATFAIEHFDPSKTAFTKPNPRKALQWYDQALKNGEPQAESRRNRLIAHLREEAERGDTAAQRILQKMKR
ncbi:MAG TPA: hypothetical protein ENI99_02390 [Sedimenticola sp.]|nr:hypothetical protein [Sedimenticola sp.]